MQSIKVLLVGPSGSGKTSFLNHHAPNRRFTDMASVEISTPLEGDTKFDVWDITGPFPEKHVRDVNSAMIFCTPSTIREALRDWLNSCRLLGPRVVVVINKIDQETISKEDYAFLKETRVSWCAISVKAESNLDVPFGFV